MEIAKKVLKIVLIVIGVLLALSLLLQFLGRCIETNKEPPVVIDYEKDFPNDYLEIEPLEMTPNFLGSKVKIKYKIKNRAIETTYKNINVEITYYNENREIIEISTIMAGKTVSPNSTETFEIERVNYKNLKSISMKIKSAEGVK